jgi:transcriptional regulator with XRE-family HTH domain
MEPAALVAENLRRIRVARGLSLSDLARRAGVAKATLVGLESGRGNPTVTTLASLADELAVELATLLADAAAPTLHVARAGTGSVISGEGTDVRFVHRTAIGGAMLEHYDLIVRAHQASPPHPAGAVEQIMVTAGELVLTVAGVATTLGEGDFIAFGADRPHAYDVGAGVARGVMTMVYPEVPAPIFTAGDLPPATSGRAAR